MKKFEILSWGLSRRKGVTFLMSTCLELIVKAMYRKAGTILLCPPPLNKEGNIKGLTKITHYSVTYKPFLT